MSVIILPFVPRAIAKPPRIRTRAVATVVERFGAQWPSKYLPLVLAALDMLQADDSDFAERCRLIASEPGALVRLVDQLSRLAGHMADVADALRITAQRIRQAAYLRHGQPT